MKNHWYISVNKIPGLVWISPDTTPPPPATHHVFFLVHRPVLGITFQCVIFIGLPRLSSAVTDPLSPLVFMALTPLKSPSQVFLQNDPQLDVMFLEIRWDLWVWSWGEPQR